MASSPITSWQIDRETMDTVADFIFLGSKITADGDCSHEIQRCLLLGWQVVTNLDSILISRDITLPAKFHLVKAMVFPVSCMDVRVGLWRKLSTEELMPLNCLVGEDSWESLGLQGDPTSPSSRTSVLGVLWKDWCWNWNSSTLITWCEELTQLKIPWSWERLRAGGEGDNRGWYGHGFGWTPAIGDEQEGLVCCGPWGHKELDTTEWLNWTEYSFFLSMPYLLYWVTYTKRMSIWRWD